uniref:Uncharacterized protein n=1 Tax=Timema cristinae TaxID=61476 RepID=A0A7R9CT99_TIMCR|nr:unnamed protein product [Timema cristinae]
MAPQNSYVLEVFINAWHYSSSLYFLSQAALQQVKKNLAPRFCHRQRCNRQRWNRSRGTLLIVSVTGCAVKVPEQPCSFMIRRYFEAVAQWKGTFLTTLVQCHYQQSQQPTDASLRCICFRQHYKEAEQAFHKVLSLDKNCEDARQQLLEVQILQLLALPGCTRAKAMQAIALTNNITDAERFIRFGSSDTNQLDEDGVFVSDDEDIDAPKASSEYDPLME